MDISYYVHFIDKEMEALRGPTASTRWSVIGTQAVCLRVLVLQPLCDAAFPLLALE